LRPILQRQTTAIRMNPINQPTKRALQGRSIQDRRQILGGLQSGRMMARAWSLGIPERQRLHAARAFIKSTIDEYVLGIAAAGEGPIQVTPPNIALSFSIDDSVKQLAHAIAREASKITTTHACYYISATYTALVPEPMRSAFGMYYTPPVLTDQLLDMRRKQELIGERRAFSIPPAVAALFCFRSRCA
jgi:hypothetical protein